ncbi:hypothetical protein [Halomonas sp. WWR20]
MRSLLPMQVIAAVSLAVLLPVAANASCAYQGETHAQQSSNTQSASTESAHKTHHGNDASHAMAVTTGFAEGGQRQHSSEESAFASQQEAQDNNFTNTLDPLEPGYMWWQ